MHKNALMLIAGTVCAMIALPAGAQSWSAAKPNVSRDPYGNPCLENVSGYATPIANSASNLYEHIVSAKNICFVPVRVEVCYRNSAQCRLLTVPPRGKGIVVLGFDPGGTYFSYDYHEVY